MKFSGHIVLCAVLAALCIFALTGCRSKTVGPYTGRGGAQQGQGMGGQGGYGGFPEGRITEEMRPGSSGEGWVNPDGPGGAGGAYGSGGYGNGGYGSGGFGPAGESLDATGAPGGRSGSLHSGNGGSRYGQGRSSSGMTSVYFDYDASSIRSDQIPALERNAVFLRGNSGSRVLIEGNTDYRGTNEYNLALGERRAASARNYLVNLGVPADRIRTISYGEERPLYPGDSESDYARNRRADFVLE